MKEEDVCQRSEQEVISCVIRNRDNFKKVDWLKPDEFLFIEHQIIWKVLLSMKEEINLISVYDRLKKEKNQAPIERGYFEALAKYGSGAGSLQFNAKRIRKKAIERRITAGEDIPPDMLKQLLDEGEKSEVVTMNSVVLSELKNILDGKHLEKIGYKTGYSKLDYCIGGLKHGDLIIIAGRPAMGKTSYALNLAVKMAENSVKTLYINLEMSAEQLARKVISMKGGISSEAFNRELNETEMRQAMSLGNDTMEKSLNLKILDKGKITLEEIRAAVAGFDLVFIDQLTKIKHISKRERLDQEIAEVTFELKSMAKEFKMPIVLLHQINREAEKRQDKRPMLADLRDSGAVEQDGDIILFIHRDSYYSGDLLDKTASVKVAKNKMGGTGEIKFLFKPEFSRFEEFG